MSGDSFQKMVETQSQIAFQMKVTFGTENDAHFLIILSMRDQDVGLLPPLTEIPGHLLKITQKTDGDVVTWTVDIDRFIVDPCVRAFLVGMLSTVHRNDHPKNPLLDRLIESKVPGEVLVKAIAYVLLQAGFNEDDESVKYAFSFEFRRMKPSSAQALVNLILRTVISPRRSVGSRLLQEVCFMLRCSDDNKDYRLGVTASELFPALCVAIQNKPRSFVKLFFCGSP